MRFLIIFFLIFAFFTGQASGADSGKVMTPNQSVETPMPELSHGFSDVQLNELTKINAQTQIREAELKLKTVESKLEEIDRKKAEADAKLKEKNIAVPGVPVGRVLPDGTFEPAKPNGQQQSYNEGPRVFPMPGGNPQVVSIIGGSKKAMEAKLVFPNGLIYEVSRGTTLENGYIVSDVSSRGVMIEKNGMRLTMPFTAGSMKGKPVWTDEMGEQGVPVNKQGKNNE